MADTRFWHPFASMAAVRDHELVIARGEGAYVWDAGGRRYLDATASLWYANIGHGDVRVADAVREQMGRLEAYSTFGDFANEPALALAERLAAVAPMPGARVFLGSGGGDGIDTAAKLARRYWHAVGQPERQTIVVRRHAYHGTHGFGTSLAGIPANAVGWGPLVPEVVVVPHDDVDALAGALVEHDVAAVFMEPVIGAGGVYPPAPGYVEGVAAACREHGALLVVDSVICGFGRLGTWFGIERWPDVEPDMIVFAKGVTSGYLPLGGVVVGGRVAEPFWEGDDAPTFRHGATYAGHPTCCAAALANLDVLEHDRLLARGQELEDDLLAVLQPLRDHGLVGEVRGGCGLLGAVELRPEVLAEPAGAPTAVAARVREEGVLVRALGSGLAVSPPLVVQREELERIGEALRAGLDRTARELPAAVS
jgi:adenosylmethionine-8-amino-7-oxononanoate aminotransferase